MAHGIYGERAAFYAKPAWHRIGTVYDQVVTVSEALQPIDFVIDRYPVGFLDPATNEFYHMDKTYTLVNRDEQFSFGVVNERYHFLQNAEVANHLDTLGFQFESIGFLDKGKTMFVVLRHDSFDVAHEQVDSFFVYKTTRDAKSRDTMMVTPIRVVCQNTLSLALKNVGAMITMNHSATLHDEVAWRIDTIKAMKAAGNNIQTALKALSSIQLTSDDVNDIIMKVLPYPTPSRTLELKGSGIKSLEDKAKQAEYIMDWKIQKIDNARALIAENHTRLCDEYTTIANTGWSLYNAVTEYTTHQANKSGNVRAKEDMFGDGLELRDMAYAEIIRR